jgi:multidrug efflux pump subunit AcrA (membrane-fusion protein)
MKKYNYCLILGVLLVFSSCSSFTEKVEENLPEVKVKEITNHKTESILVNGEVTPLNETNFKAEINNAEVKKILVKVGDKVKKGDVLLTMYSEDIVKQLETAKNSVYYAKESVLKTGETGNSQIKSARNAYQKALTNQKNTLIQYEKQKKQAEEQLNSILLNQNLQEDVSLNALKTAKEKLETESKVIESSNNSVKVNLDNAKKQAKTIISSSLIEVDQILGVSSLYEHENDDFEKFLASRDSTLKKQAENLLENNLEKFKNLSNNYEDILELLNSMEDLTQKTLEILKNSSTGLSFTQSSLNALIAKINNSLQLLRTNLANLENSKEQYENTLKANLAKKSALEANLENAEKQLSLIKKEVNGKSQTLINAEKQYETTIANLNSMKESAEMQVKSAKLALDQAINNVKLSENGAQSSFNSQKGALEQAVINQEKLTVKANFSGIVSNIFVKVGEEVNMGTSLLKIENTETYKIVAYLNTEEVMGLEQGQIVKIGNKSEDKITAISPSIDPVNKKHRVEILHKNKYLKSGQIVKLKFIKELNNKISNKVFIPLNTVFLSSQGNYVFLKNEKNALEKKFVKIGEVKGDLIEITEGLKQGDLLVEEGARQLKEGQIIKSIK